MNGLYETRQSVIGNIVITKKKTPVHAERECLNLCQNGPTCGQVFHHVKELPINNYPVQKPIIVHCLKTLIFYKLNVAKKVYLLDN